MKTPINSINSSLATACQLTQGSCCKNGLLFLPEDEYQAIVEWVAANSASELGLDVLSTTDSTSTTKKMLVSFSLKQTCAGSIQKV